MTKEQLLEEISTLQRMVDAKSTLFSELAAHSMNKREIIQNIKQTSLQETFSILNTKKTSFPIEFTKSASAQLFVLQDQNNALGVAMEKNICNFLDIYHPLINQEFPLSSTCLETFNNGGIVVYGGFRTAKIDYSNVLNADNSDNHVNTGDEIEEVSQEVKDEVNKILEEPVEKTLSDLQYQSMLIAYEVDNANSRVLVLPFQTFATQQVIDKSKLIVESYSQDQITKLLNDETVEFTDEQKQLKDEASLFSQQLNSIPEDTLLATGKLPEITKSGLEDGSWLLSLPNNIDFPLENFTPEFIVYNSATDL